jgi:FkbM family methyltransferase
MSGQPLALLPATVRQLGRRTVNRFGLDITRNPFSRRLVQLCANVGVDAVADIGANTGQYAKMLRCSGFGGRIVSCEPLAEPYRALAQAARADAGWDAVRTALGSEQGTVTVRVAGNSYSSSVLDMLDAHRDAAPGSSYIGSEEAPLTTVDALFTASALQPERTLLKLDVQGYEGVVLHAADGVLPWLAAVQVELSLVPLYAGQPLMAEITRHLERYGLALWAIEPGFTDPRSGRMLQCDGVFVRG